MSDGETLKYASRADGNLLTRAWIGETNLFDGDIAISEWEAHVTSDSLMKTEIRARRNITTKIIDLAHASENKGYRHAAALLLETADRIDRALISDNLPVKALFD